MGSAKKLAAKQPRQSKAIATKANGTPTPTAGDIPIKADSTPPGPRELTVTIPKDGNRDKALAHSGLNPAVKAAALSNSLVSPMIGTNSVMGSLEALQELIAEVQSGDLRQADAMMVAQAYTLDSLFMDLLRRWQLNTSHNHQISESYLRLALKAQSQARTTWESLAAVKYPNSPTFVRQANFANGPQQINNGSGPGKADVGDVREIESKPNELNALEGVSGRAVD